MRRVVLAGCWLAVASFAWGQDRRYYEPVTPPQPLPRGGAMLDVPPPPAGNNPANDPFNEPPRRFVPSTPINQATPDPRGFQSPAPSSYPVVPAAANAPVEGPPAPPPAPVNATPPLEQKQAPVVAEAPADDHDSAIVELVEDGAEATRAKFLAAWNYPLTTVDGKVITPGTVLCCLLLLWVGYLSSKTISWWFGSRFLPRLGMHQSAVAPVQTITFYVLVATFTMMSLRLANVPLTAFTFLGGAIAIGVGFGSQNVVNNFISGLILLAERPIRVGDVIQVEGFTGTVSQIGPRSTQVTTSNNVVIVLPNSKLLEGTVVNWTLSDDRIRTKIVAGVSYGSRTRDVEQLMLTAARKHPDVLKEPAPMVVFAEFGDNALQFELHFWMAINGGTSRSEVESDIRFEIDEQFRTAGIVMAYPQRDVHLNVLRPVEIRMVEGAGERNRLRAA